MSTILSAIAKIEAFESGLIPSLTCHHHLIISWMLQALLSRSTTPLFQHLVVYQVIELDSYFFDRRSLSIGISTTHITISSVGYLRSTSQLIYTPSHACTSASSWVTPSEYSPATFSGLSRYKHSYFVIQLSTTIFLSPISPIC